MATAATRGSFLGPRKTIEETLAATELETHRLRRNLGTLDVVIVGVGAMVGAGIFVLTGQAAATKAGPAITISFVMAGVSARWPRSATPSSPRWSRPPAARTRTRSRPSAS